ncbi:MAG: TobH protein, partial [Mycobacteriaceae bacterium]
SVVLVAPRGPARRAAALTQALTGDVSSVPVVIAAHTPRWVGPLDVVLVATDDPGDAELAESVARAASRGAEVVLATPEEGLLPPAAAGRALLLPPRVPVPEGMGLLRFVAAGLAVLAAVGVCETPNLAVLADAIDAEAEGNQAGRDVLANPAKSLALRCAGRRLLIAADSPSAGAVAAHLAAALLAHAGVVTTPVELAEALVATTAAASSSDSLFHDREIDGPLASEPLRVLLLATTAGLPQLQARSAGLADMDVTVGAIETGVLQGDPIAELLVLTTRCVTAAVYLGLATDHR